MTIADRIRNRRLELGLSVDDLARLLNKNRATVYRYESSYIKSYSPDVMESLAKALQTTPAYFYGYEDDSESSETDPEIHIVTSMMETMTKEQKQQVIDLIRILMKNQKS